MIEIKAYKCEFCGHLYKEADKSKVEVCCKCKRCKHYIGRFNKKWHWIHCKCGYTCDSYSSEGKKGTYSRFE